MLFEIRNLLRHHADANYIDRLSSTLVRAQAAISEDLNNSNRDNDRNDAFQANIKWITNVNRRAVDDLRTRNDALEAEVRQLRQRLAHGPPTESAEVQTFERVNI